MNGDSTSDCEHEWFGIPDSLARCCEKCGDVQIPSGKGKWEPWKYKSGKIIEWAKDLCDGDNKHNKTS